MTAVGIYFAVLLMVASLIAKRTGERRLRAQKALLAAVETEFLTLDQSLAEQNRTLDTAHARLSGLEQKVADVQAKVDALNFELDAVSAAPVEQYHVFDRLEPRPGVIWEVPVRRASDAAPGNAVQARAWNRPRTYLIVAGNQREALDRAAQRFPRGSGFEIGTITTCRLFDAGQSGGASANPAKRRRG